MVYVILDLEWNNTYGRKTKSFINEIIEIGAVMLDEDLQEISQFSSLIRSQIGKKLRGSVKQLTHITNEDLNSGLPFTKALSELRRWIGNRENVVITWGDGDIRVLIENCRYLNGIEIVPFLSNYADIQAYFHSIFNSPPSRQVGLSAAAQLLGIDETEFSHHRALDDSLLTAEVFHSRGKSCLNWEHSFRILCTAVSNHQTFAPGQPVLVCSFLLLLAQTGIPSTRRPNH